jgi:UDPglucose 6-dehydrogenase
MRVGVIGTGHVGLVTSVTLAAVGHDVVGMDNDGEKIEQLCKGTTPFFEPGVDGLLRAGLDDGRLRFTTDAEDAVSPAEVVFICVGTPPRAAGEASLVAVEQAARDVARFARGHTVVVEKSTVPAGTSYRIRRTLMHECPDQFEDLDVVSSPEFLREGTAVEDTMRPDRILVGAESLRAFEVMRRIYEPFVANGSKLMETDIATAELAKHSCNAFLALKISFANALARICERSGADVSAVADIMGADARIGREFLDAGLGYGGYCLPKDVAAFERLSHRLGYDFTLLQEIKKINDQAIDAAFAKVEDLLWNLEYKRIALLGLSFKAGTDDVRFSPALALAQRLIDEGAEVIGYDPQAGANAKNELHELVVAPDPYDAVTGAHCVVACTEWPEFMTLDLPKVRSLMAYPVVVDGRNMFNPDRMKELGFNYFPTGRPTRARRRRGD